MKYMHKQTLIFALLTAFLASSCTSMETRTRNSSRIRGPYQATGAANSQEAPPPPRYSQRTSPSKSTSSSQPTGARKIVSSTGNSTQSAAAYREDQRINQEFRAAMKIRIDQLAEENARLGRELAALRSQSGANSTSSAEVLSLRAKVSELEGKLASIDQRSLVNQSTIQEIPNTIHNIMSKYQPKASASSGSTRRSNPSSSGSKPRTLEGYEYTVGKGDTLSAIAAAYGVSAKTIIDANDISNPDNLQLNQTLFIPK